ncbi:PI-PLC X domain-containing protein 3 [Tupaia chinensis]|uniref:PI-PLC X domain-containing protein 3 n=1 Tax=Tupaia chinensis TaxID=246437 RepID=L9KB24_TUPCH|nr:PI-PLC X domain-containing protein 3 [Tupaia chinensis]
MTAKERVTKRRGRGQLRNLPAILEWVKTQKPGTMGVNIITSDFVDLVDFATTVIELNDLLQEDRALAKC